MKKATEMTPAELASAARNYDNAINEGGEGYNPYTSEIERRDYAEAAGRPKTKQDEIDVLYSRINRECGSVAREWGNNEELDAKQTALYTEINRIKAEIDAEFLIDWPLDITKTRRQGWNDFVRSFGPGRINRDGMTAIHNRQKEQGWTLDSLKKAVQLHNL